MSRNRPADSVEEALSRASSHARNALSEAVAACRALLDAVSLLAIDQPAQSNSRLASLARILENLEARISPAGRSADPVSESLLQALAEALDAEITRWEGRASHDREARAVLRAFLGMREILWEMGIRTQAPPPPASETHREGTPFERNAEPVQPVRLQR